MRLVRWVLAVTLGETLGFTVPAAVGIAVTGDSWGPLSSLVAILLAGSVEGALLGAAQADRLYRWRVLPTRRRWIVARAWARQWHGHLGCCRVPSVVCAGLPRRPFSLELAGWCCLHPCRWLSTSSSVIM